MIECIVGQSMEAICPNCGEINKIGGLFFKTNNPDGELRADGMTHRTTIQCIKCNWPFVPHPLENKTNEQPAKQSS
jgi:hypothetical protein